MPETPASSRSPLPSPRVGAALVLGTLAFGAVLGNAVAGSADANGPGRKIIIVLPGATPQQVAAASGAAVPTTTTPPDELGSSDTPTVDETSDLSDDDTATDDTAADDPSADDGTATDDTTTDDSGGSDDTDNSDTTGDDTATPAPKLPPIEHVWIVALTGHSYDETFGPASPAPYVSQELRAKGTLLPWYTAVGHDPSAGGIALLGGQKDAVGPFGDKVATLVDQLTSGGKAWKAYVEGATDGLQPGDSPCARPPEQAPRNPFLRFASLTGGTDCGRAMGDPSQLAADVADAASTPAFSYILPGPAHDGSASLADADAWLRTTLAPVLESKAYKDSGLVVITFDAGAPDDTIAGGGRVGALVLSPFAEAGGTVNAPYDAFALLATLDRLFGLDPLGYAADTRLKPFGRKVFARWSPDD